MALRSTDRILVLERVNKADKHIGLIDPKVFTGDNNLHAVMDPSTCMWTFKYEHGMVPPQLRSKFTDFNTLKKHAEIYFNTKSIRITGVKD